MFNSDVISDLPTDLETTKTDGDTAYLVFLNLCRAYDFLPHCTILDQLQAPGFSKRVFNFTENFLRDRL